MYNAYGSTAVKPVKPVKQGHTRQRRTKDLSSACSALRFPHTFFYVGPLIYSLLRRRSLGSSRADETHCYSQDTYYYSEDTYYLFSVIVRVRVVFRKTVVGD